MSLREPSERVLDTVRTRRPVRPGVSRVFSSPIWFALLLLLSGRSSHQACLAQDESGPEKPTAPTIDSARDFLELLGVSESELDFFQSGEPFSSDEYDSLNRFLTIIPRLPQRRVLRWQRSDVDWEKVQSAPRDFQGELLPVSGRLVSIQPHELNQPTAERYGFRKYFECVIQLTPTSGSKNPPQIVLFTRVVPRRLLDPKPMPKPSTDETPSDEVAEAPNIESIVNCHERIRCVGLFLKSTGAANENFDKGQGGAYLVANSFAWYPDSNRSSSIDADVLQLANRGFDAGSLDTVTDRTPLGGHDREAFYQMLAAVGRADPGWLEKYANPANAKQLLVRKPSDRGRFFTFRGTVRRAIRVEVDDLEIVERLGITHYYELEIFDATTKVKMKRYKGDKHSVEFNSYPVVFCAHEIPKEMATGDFIHENVEVTGAYLKQWAYETEFLSQSVAKGQRRPRQFSPLLIGRIPKLLTARSTTHPQAGVFVGIVFVMALVGLVSVLVWSGRRDRQFRKRLNEVIRSAQDE